MEKVVGSNPITRSEIVVSSAAVRSGFLVQWTRGDVAEWLGRGLQNPVRRFNSARRLRVNMPGWRNWQTQRT